jgi:hypothetical protein
VGIILRHLSGSRQWRFCEARRFTKRSTSREIRLLAPFLLHYFTKIRAFSETFAGWGGIPQKIMGILMAWFLSCENDVENLWKTVENFYHPVEILGKGCGKNGEKSTER